MRNSNALVRWSGGLFAAVGAYILIIAQTFPMPKISDKMGPRFVPEILAVLLILLGVIVIIAPGRKIDAKPAWKGVGIVLITGIAYILLLPNLGFLLSTLVVLTALINYLNRPNFLKSTLISVILSGVFYLIFVVLLRISFP